MELVPVRYERHVFVCVNEREGVCCSKRGSESLVAALKNHVAEKGLGGKYKITRSGCLGQCNDGPAVAVYPDGLIFRKVSVEDAKKIIDEFLPA